MTYIYPETRRSRDKTGIYNGTRFDRLVLWQVKYHVKYILSAVEGLVVNSDSRPTNGVVNHEI
jgi:hypothetical protein